MQIFNTCQAQRELLLQKKEKKANKEQNYQEKQHLKEQIRIQQMDEEEARKLKEEKERQEYEEYLKIKEKIVVQEEGDTEFTEEQDKKIVEFDAIASQFQMSSPEAVKRVETLMEQGELQGYLPG
ncbi:hypothetical protein MXB_945 [Myxobolus squamalis]|nr:hypothetical protein MXB_945 [Myxobolus squamalis]